MIKTEHEPRTKMIRVSAKIFDIVKAKKEMESLDSMHDALCLLCGLPEFIGVKPKKIKKSRRNGRPPGPIPTHKVYNLKLDQTYSVKYPPESEYPNDPNGYRFRDKIRSAYRWHNKVEWNNEREHTIETEMTGVRVTRTK